MLLEHLHIEVAQVRVPLLRPLESLLPRVLQQEILQVLRLSDPLGELGVLDRVRIVCIYLLEDREGVLRDVLSVRDREPHHLTETLDTMQEQCHEFLAVDKAGFIRVEG